MGSLWLTLLARPYTSGCARTLERGVSKRRVGSPAVIGMELPESLAVIGLELPESLAVTGASFVAGCKVDTTKSCPLYFPTCHRWPRPSDAMIALSDGRHHIRVGWCNSNAPLIGLLENWCGSVAPLPRSRSQRTPGPVCSLDPVRTVFCQPLACHQSSLKFPETIAAEPHTASSPFPPPHHHLSSSTHPCDLLLLLALTLISAWHAPGDTARSALREQKRNQTSTLRLSLLFPR